MHKVYFYRLTSVLVKSNYNRRSVNFLSLLLTFMSVVYDESEGENFNQGAKSLFKRIFKILNKEKTDVEEI